LRRRRRSGPGIGQAISTVIVATFFLLVLFAPASEPENHHAVLGLQPAVEILVLAAFLALVGMAGLRLPSPLRLVLAAILLFAALLNFADALMPALYGREPDLYWDLPQVPALFGLYYDSVGVWRGAAATAGGGVALVLVFAVIVLALWAIERVAARRRGIAVALIALAVLALGTSLMPPPGGAAPTNDHLSRIVAQQGRLFYRAWQVAHGHLGTYAAALAAPQRQTADLAGLKHRDVLLIYFESYGTVALDNPAYRAAIAPALARFADKTAASGYTLLSDRILSPTFGGGSWLAHGTMASGSRLDQFLSRLLLESKRRSLPRYMEEAGYRTVNVMPGIKKPWPEGSFWGFDKHYYASDLDYRGPEFGWFGIPDQYTLKKFATRENSRGNRPDGKPLFAQIVLVSSHTPFYPVPPYRIAWADAGDYIGVTPQDWERIYRQPDWNHLAPAYLESLTYDLDVLGDFLATRVADGALVIILGDHQPPAFISGENQPWTVPIYVLSKDPDLVAPFRALGYQPGAIPEQKPPFRGMESFLGDFLDGFSTKAPAAAAPTAAVPGPAASAQQ
jgi:hypothetical protein